MASTSLFDLAPVLEAWEQGGRAAVESLTRQREKLGGKGNRENYHWLAGKAVSDAALQIHKGIRRLVRQEAGKLG